MAAMDMLTSLERGDIHLAQSLVRSIPPHDERFVNYPLEPVDMLAACHPGLELGSGATVEVAQLAPYPLLNMTADFVVRKSFDAACRLAGVTPNILLESRAPHALLAMAEAGHGVAIIPSALRTHHYKLRIVRVTYKGDPLREPLTMLYHKRRPLPRYAAAFCEMLAEYVREIFPMTRPSEDARAAKPKRSDRRKRVNVDAGGAS
jgi:DNA-binding transcriptional LysR family regulator